jgi:hypothetical protein
MAKRRKSKTKRTITPEHLAAMQEGRLKAAEKREKDKVYKERVADAERLEKKMRDAQRESDKPVKVPGRKRYHRF